MQDKGHARSQTGFGTVLRALQLRLLCHVLFRAQEVQNVAVSPISHLVLI